MMRNAEESFFDDLQDVMRKHGVKLIAENDYYEGDLYYFATKPHPSLGVRSIYREIKDLPDVVSKDFFKKA
jgi:hypothetical protein